MGSKFKIFNVLVRNKMQSATVLPSFGFTTDVWNMGQFQLIQLLMHIWGLYQALCGNYHALQADNVRLGELLAKAEERADNAEKHSDRRHYKNEDLQQEIIELKIRTEDAADEAQYWQCRAEEAERKLEAIYEQEAAEAEILRELSRDPSWTSVSKGNFVKKQTKAVLEANAKVLALKSQLRTSLETCQILADSVSRLCHCPIELGVPVFKSVLCVGVRNGPAFVSSAETAKNLKGKHPLLHEETFVLRTLSGLDATIGILFKTQAQNALLAKSLQQ